jgi:hypothetical protein
MWSQAEAPAHDSAASLRVVQALRASLEGFNKGLPWYRLHLGRPPDDGSPWFPFQDLLSPGFAGRVIKRVAELEDATYLVAGTYTFRYAIQIPLSLAGYLFAAGNRVPALRNNLLLADKDWLNECCLLSPALTVAEGDELTTEAGVTAVQSETELVDALFHETERLINPLLDAWVPRKLVARANAWASALDALAYGFQMAGRQAIGLDEAWNKWDAAIRGREFPVRRRPRRFQFKCDGEADELLVRSGCCLWYTLPAAKEEGQNYCTSCYLESDGRRREKMIAYKRKQKEEGEGAPS